MVKVTGPLVAFAMLILYGGGWMPWEDAVVALLFILAVAVCYQTPRRPFEEGDS